MDTKTPAARPINPRFSSGPCAKPPTWNLNKLARSLAGSQSHRAALAVRPSLAAAIDGTRELLGIPDDYRIGIVPASDTGAVEMAMWSLLGARKVDDGRLGKLSALAGSRCGQAAQAGRRRSKAPIMARSADLDYGRLRTTMSFSPGTVPPRGARAGWGLDPHRRAGLTICDATSAAFAMDLPWDKLDVTTFSWQKVLGGEAAHGMIVLSPRAVSGWKATPRPGRLPKIFRLTKGGKLIDGDLPGRDINTPSMLAVEDYLDALTGRARSAGLTGLIARADANAQAVRAFDATTGSPIWPRSQRHARTPRSA